MHDYPHIVQGVFQHVGQPGKRHVRSPLSVDPVDANPVFGRDSMVGIHWTCAKTFAKTSRKTTCKTWEGDSNTEDEVASA
jgi:hypothetical protein